MSPEYCNFLLKNIGMQLKPYDKTAMLVPFQVKLPRPVNLYAFIRLPENFHDGLNFSIEIDMTSNRERTCSLAGLDTQGMILYRVFTGKCFHERGGHFVVKHLILEVLPVGYSIPPSSGLHIFCRKQDSLGINLQIHRAFIASFV